jgi:alcohol dehydrogenase (cytochrome c)
LCAIPKTRIGVNIARAKVTGSLADIEWTDLYRMFRSTAHFNLTELAKTGNPYESIHDPYASKADVATGQQLFKTNCALCHGADATGAAVGPGLAHRHMVQGSSDWALFRTISFGIPGTAMAGHNDLPWHQKWQLVAYIQSLTVQGVAQEDYTQPTVQAQPVPYETLRTADKNQADWLTYSGSYDGHHFSGNDQITTANVGGLRLLWARQYTTTEESVETSPLAVNGYLFVTAPPGRVEALDGKTGAVVWSYDRALPDHISLCCGVENRGLAVLGNTLFVGTLDAHLIALNMTTGAVLWDVVVADYKAGYSITGAPLALKNLVLTGLGGGEFAIQGFISARDAATGKEVWRFNTIARGEPGADSWSPGTAANTGGAATWLTGSFDPRSNVVYWPTGNPVPEFNGDSRQGDNLYTNSVVALDADTGSLRWTFQYMPHDAFDWDSAQVLVLLDANVAGQDRRVLAQANRNGFFYLLDAANGKLLLTKPFAKQTWSDHTDSIGRPAINPQAYPSPRGTATYPGTSGGANWESPSYDPITKRMYVPFMDWGGIYYKRPAQHQSGEMFLAGSFSFFSYSTARAVLSAINPITGEADWEYRNSATNIGGLLSTAGGLVFGSQLQTLFALDASTGKELWTVHTGGRTVAAPMSFLSGGKQLITVATGHDLLTFGL